MFKFDFFFFAKPSLQVHTSLAQVYKEKATLPLCSFSQWISFLLFSSLLPSLPLRSLRMAHVQMSVGVADVSMFTRFHGLAGANCPKAGGVCGNVQLGVE